MGSLVKKSPSLMYMDVAAMCLHASSQTNTIVTTTPFSVSRPLKYSGAMMIASKLVIAITTTSYGMGQTNNQVVVVGFKVLAKPIFVMGDQVATL